MHRLADTPTNHPALWGEIQVHSASTIVVENRAIILPQLKRRGISKWWARNQQGAYSEDGIRIDAINDFRGHRHIFHPPHLLKQAEFNESRTIEQDLLIYGGTIFDHFGHLLLDLTRLYQVLRLYRHCKTPISVHVHTTYPGKGVTSPLAQQWLSLLGVENRIKVIRRPIKATTLVSSSALYRDRCFVSQDFYAATSTALAPNNQDHLNQIKPKANKVAYLSRHKLTSGTTKFIQEEELVEKLKLHPEIDIICPEELNFLQKLELYKLYPTIAGFPQACMNLKAFVPSAAGNPVANQVMLIAGPQSLSSNWINIDKACEFNDYYVDCPAKPGSTAQQEEDGFQRGNQFDVNTAYTAITSLIARI